MICNGCGNAIDSVNKFCPKCGAPVQPPVQAQAPYVGESGYGYTPPQMGGPTAVTPRKSSCGKVLLILGIILVLVIVAIGAAAYFGYRTLENTLKSSEAYTVAINELKANEEVKEKLGDINDTGFPIGAYSSNADGSGTAAFYMSVQGTKGSGKYTVELERSNSVWELKSGNVTLPDGEVIQIKRTRVIIGDAPNVNINNNNNGQDNVRDRNAISGGVLNGKATSLPKPPYPPVARSVKASGTVVVQVLVNEEGNVIAARALSGHPLLRAAAVAAARQAKFEPRVVGGRPVKVSGTLTYNFVPE